MKMGITLRYMFENIISIEMNKSYMNDILALNLQMFLYFIIASKILATFRIMVWTFDLEMKIEEKRHVHIY